MVRVFAMGLGLYLGPVVGVTGEVRVWDGGREGGDRTAVCCMRLRAGLRVRVSVSLQSG